MEQNLKFNKEGKLWYIDLPQWTGFKAELEMVAGADKLLDALDVNKENTIKLLVSTKPLPRSNITLSKLVNCFGGATYMVKSTGFNRPIWICAVTKYVFGGLLPKRIYIKI
tara:strand:+ start:872 stop:1204 length:333 start_codon:yes stop_codon:yes gene_type:complete